MRVLADQSAADTGSALFWALHGVHIALVAVGIVAVLLLLAPARMANRRVQRLRKLGTADAILVAAQDRARADLAGPRPDVRRARNALIAVVAANLVAATIHGAVCPGHFAEGLRFGLFFLALMIAQVWIAVAAARNPSPRIIALGLVINFETVVMWALTRTVGLPYGIAKIEAVGLWDTVASIAELIAVGASTVLLVLLTRPRVVPGRHLSAAAR